MAWAFIWRGRREEPSTNNKAEDKEYCDDVDRASTELVCCMLTEHAMPMLVVLTMSKNLTQAYCLDTSADGSQEHSDKSSNLYPLTRKTYENNTLRATFH